MGRKINPNFLSNLPSSQTRCPLFVSESRGEAGIWSHENADTLLGSTRTCSPCKQTLGCKHRPFDLIDAASLALRMRDELTHWIWAQRHVGFFPFPPLVGVTWPPLKASMLSTLQTWPRSPRGLRVPRGNISGLHSLGTESLWGVWSWAHLDKISDSIPPTQTHK